MLQENLKSNLTDDASTSENCIINLYPEAYLKIIYHSLTYANRLRDKNDWLEVMGWLSGKITKDKSTNFEIIHVTKSWAISHGDAVSVKIDDYGKALNKVLVKLSNRNESILGWYHSHPSYGLFMSQTDFDTQLSYQRLFKQAVALVFDHTLWSDIHSGIEAYRLQSDFKTFEKIPIMVANYKMNLNSPLYKIFMKITNKIYLDEIDSSNEY